MNAENPKWKEIARNYVPKSGTTAPLTLTELRFIPIFDSVGRTLIETSGINPSGVIYEFVDSVHKDSGRDGSQVNRSAYTSVMEVFPQALDLISYLREGLMQAQNKNTPNNMAMVVGAAFTLPLLLVHRAEDPVPNGDVQPYVTAASKIARGAIVPFQKARFPKLGLGLEILDEPPRETLVSPDPYVQLLFDQNYLVSEEEACPAPRPIIENFAHVLFSSTDRQTDQVAQDLNLTPAQFRQLGKFGIAFMDATSMRSGMEQIQEEHIYLQKDPTDIFLRKMNEFLRTINHELGRSDPIPLTQVTMSAVINPGIPAGFRRKKR